MVEKTIYEIRVGNRNFLHFILGLLTRLRCYLKNFTIVSIARLNGATIGDSVTMPLKLAFKSNSNLVIGDSCVIQTSSIDVRAKIIIGRNVVIGEGVNILTCSHDVDSREWNLKTYGIIIEDYAWLATRSFVLPSCQKIEYGAVCGAGSVVVRNVGRMNVVVGNPAFVLKIRKNVHEYLCVESLVGNDLKRYVDVYFKK